MQSVGQHSPPSVLPLFVCDAPFFLLCSATLSFSQLIKVLIGPVQAVYQWLVLSRPSSPQAVGALFIMTVGIGSLFVTDLMVTLVSLLCGLIYLASSVLGQAVSVFIHLS